MSLIYHHEISLHFQLIYLQLSDYTYSTEYGLIVTRGPNTNVPIENDDEEYEIPPVVDENGEPMEDDMNPNGQSPSNWTTEEMYPCPYCGEFVDRFKFIISNNMLLQPYIYLLFVMLQELNLFVTLKCKFMFNKIIHHLSSVACAAFLR
jgi:hypothetical protein